MPVPDNREDHSIQRCVQLLFPMGGLGSRFADSGYGLPKPLIPLQEGLPMIVKSISSFAATYMNANHDGQSTDENGEESLDEYTIPTGSLPLRLIFIVREEHEREYKLRTYLQQLFSSCKTGIHNSYNNNDNNNNNVCLSPTARELVHHMDIVDVQFVMMDHNTRGAVETCLLAKHILYADNPVIVTDCDLFFRSHAYERYLCKLLSQSARVCEGQSTDIDKDKNYLAGLLVYFPSTSPRYSYARLKENGSGDVLETVEKVPVSSCALIGAYAFATAALFLRAGESLMRDVTIAETGISTTTTTRMISLREALMRRKEEKEDVQKGEFSFLVKEYYLSLLYNYLLHWGFCVKAVPMDEFASFGTPEELERYKQGLVSYVES
ncbi:putative nucleotidyl transferase [Trypanosoma theileri]|uniref:Putative nucleotidyl transferase n=1 Tax=Trypanosoma theileri TaxID=67003 RepID=A0A1X0NP67_9TRYP|nr:putative nucleotidyl transferase [Trypanosoma theileri]ORC86308.1 putative nucleotidyl transferase [Trypanosoma theileri]